jgi:L-ascorbate metabolism protein UlaG (beta-lactamase superfamily)
MVGGSVLLSGSVGAEEAAKPRFFFVGHATVLIEGKTATVLTDPFFKKNVIPGVPRIKPPALTVGQLPPVDVALVSHTHPDHFDPKAILALSPRPIVVMPWGRGGSLKKKGVTVVDLKPWATWEHKGVLIEAVPARHNAWHNLGYVIRMDGKTIYFTGDTKLFKDLDKIGARGIDLMLMPYGGTPLIGNIWTPPQAAEAVGRVHPRVVVPIHWDTVKNWITRRPCSPPDKFITLAKAKSPATFFLMPKTGDTFPFPGMDENE